MKKNTLSYPQTVELHKFLTDNNDALAVVAMEDVAARASRFLGFPVRATNVKRLNAEFNLGLGARVVIREPKNTVQNLIREYEANKKQTFQIFAAIIKGVLSLYEDLGMEVPEELTEFSFKISTMDKA